MRGALGALGARGAISRRLSRRESASLVAPADQLRRRRRGHGGDRHSTSAPRTRALPWVGQSAPVGGRSTGAGPASMGGFLAGRTVRFARPLGHSLGEPLALRPPCMPTRGLNAFPSRLFFWSKGELRPRWELDTQGRGRCNALGTAPRLVLVPH